VVFTSLLSLLKVTSRRMHVCRAPFQWHKPDTCVTITLRDAHFLFWIPFVWTFCIYNTYSFFIMPQIFWKKGWFIGQHCNWYTGKMSSPPALPLKVFFPISIQCMSWQFFSSTEKGTLSARFPERGEEFLNLVCHLQWSHPLMFPS
jgi:hypothetical protein